MRHSIAVPAGALLTNGDHSSEAALVHVGVVGCRHSTARPGDDGERAALDGDVPGEIGRTDLEDVTAREVETRVVDRLAVAPGIRVRPALQRPALGRDGAELGPGPRDGSLVPASTKTCGGVVSTVQRRTTVGPPDAARTCRACSPSGSPSSTTGEAQGSNSPLPPAPSTRHSSPPAPSCSRSNRADVDCVAPRGPPVTRTGRRRPRGHAADPRRDEHAVTGPEAVHHRPEGTPAVAQGSADVPPPHLTAGRDVEAEQRPAGRPGVHDVVHHERRPAERLGRRHRPRRRAGLDVPRLQDAVAAAHQQHGMTVEGGRPRGRERPDGLPRAGVEGATDRLVVLSADVLHPYAAGVDRHSVGPAAGAARVRRPARRTVGGSQDVHAETREVRVEHCVAAHRRDAQQPVEP